MSQQSKRKGAKNMKITFLGTSHGVPEPNRKCTCIMIEAGGNVYFVDMGSSAIEALRTRNIPVDHVKGVFITHMHGDHTNGLIQFADLVTWYFITPDPAIFLPDMEGKKVIEDWLRVTQNPRQMTLPFKPVHSGVIFDDGVLKVTAFPTLHCSKSFAYLVEGNGKRILFTGDLKHPAIDFPLEALDGGIDLLVCEAAHFSALEYLPILENHDIRKICVTHHWEHYFISVLQLKQALDHRQIPALIAWDGTELVV